MENRNSWNSGDPLSSQLGELHAIGAVHVDKSVHVSNAEFLNGILWISLPLWSQSIDKQVSTLRPKRSGNYLHRDPSTSLKGLELASIVKCHEDGYLPDNYA